MKNRPVAAGGEIQAGRDEPERHLPQVEEPAVSVLTQQAPLPRRGGTAQIAVPEEPARGIAWWVYVLIFALAAGAVTTGLILLKRHRDRQQALEAQRRRARIAALKRKHQARRAAPPPAARRERVARAIRVRPRRRRTGPVVWKGSCPPRSVRIRSRRRGLDYCIDRYEFPNREGAPPATALDAAEARDECRDQGKRLCTREEWVYACEGPRKRLFAYGRRYREGICVTADTKGRRREPQPTGSHPRCRTRRGIYDLNGNMAEWVAGGQLMGGSAAKPGTQTSCESDTGSGGTAYNGLRCCADPKD